MMPNVISCPWDESGVRGICLPATGERASALASVLSPKETSAARKKSLYSPEHKPAQCDKHNENIKQRVDHHGWVHWVINHILSGPHITTPTSSR